MRNWQANSYRSTPQRRGLASPPTPTALTHRSGGLLTRQSISMLASGRPRLRWDPHTRHDIPLLRR
jgi:hypothetical protein